MKAFLLSWLSQLNCLVGSAAVESVIAIGPVSVNNNHFNTELSAFCIWYAFGVLVFRGGTA
jgi:hypothetical protein